MTNDADLKDLSTHFEFGENWRSYADLIDEHAIEQAQEALLKLISRETWSSSRILDIGSGSGLHSLAALRLGAAEVVAIDIDPNSVETTRRVVAARAPGAPFRAEVLSVFEADPGKLGEFDIVYSWGVLHHTGDMWNAVAKAATLVRPGGLFALALYQKRPTCGFWTWEKRVYTNMGRWPRKLARGLFGGMILAHLTMCGRNPIAYVRNYGTDRGMSFWHDVHDWMGGYPYESSTPDETVEKLGQMGFAPDKVLALPRGFGFFGTGCAEYVFRRKS